MANATKGRKGGREGGRHFPQKIKQISFFMGLDVGGGGDNRACKLAAWNKTSAREKAGERDRKQDGKGESRRGFLN